MRSPLQQYPAAPARAGLLLVVLLVNVAQYYAVYVHGSVSTILIDKFDMSLTFYVSISIAGSVLGGIASVAAGLGDRFGRVNLMLGGLLVESVLVGWVIPMAGTKAELLVWSVIASAVEGIVLVLTPALVRDFSPQLSRGAAMGVWALGPVLGNLAASSVASRTLRSRPEDWRLVFHLCGAAGLVVLVVAALTLRELEPGLRNRVLSPSVAVAETPRESLLTPRIVVPALGFSLYLFFYTTRTAFFVIYFATTFAYTAARANSLDNWGWGATAVAVVVGGIVGDRVRARKPLMLAGLTVTLVCTLVWAALSTRAGTSYSSFAVLLVVMACGGGLVTPNFMASYSEALERRNPSLVATGMAIWGWMLRFGVAISVTGVVLLVPAASTLVDHGPQVKRIATTYAAQLATLQAISPSTRAELATNPTPAAQQAAVADIMKATGVPAADAVAALRATAAVPKADLAYLTAHAADVKAAAADGPGQWQRWWWICLLGELGLVPAVLLLPGAWRPRRVDPEASPELVAA